MVKITINEEMKQRIGVVAVDTLIFSVGVRASNNYRKLPEKSLSVLMVKENDKDVWQVPRTLKQTGENLEQAAYRKIREVAGREDYYMEQLYSFSDSYNQSDSSVNISYLILAPEQILSQSTRSENLIYQWFEVTYKNSNLRNFQQDEELFNRSEDYIISLKASEESNDKAKVTITVNPVSKVFEPKRTFSVIALDNIGLLDSHILICGIERLRNKIEYTDIIFHLMPERFTLTELQQVQELILDEKLYTAHFRRKVEQKLFKCENQTNSAKGHRPAQQYEYNPNWKSKIGMRGI